MQNLVDLLQEKFDTMNQSLKEDIERSDNNIKALWDSFTLFTASIK